MDFRKLFFVLILFSILTSQSPLLSICARTSEDEFAQTLQNAEDAVISAYKESLEAERSGANISHLLVQLNDAGSSLARARIAYSLGDFASMTALANVSENIAIGVQNEAAELKNSALDQKRQQMLFTMIASVASIALIALGSLGTWHLLKKHYEAVELRQR